MAKRATKKTATKKTATKARTKAERQLERQEEPQTEPQAMAEHTGTILVVTQYKDAGGTWSVDEESTREIPIKVFATKPAVVRVANGMTLNLGGHQFARVDVGLEMPCYAEEIQPAFAVARELVRTEIHGMVRKIKEGGRRAE